MTTETRRTASASAPRKGPTLEEQQSWPLSVASDAATNDASAVADSQDQDDAAEAAFQLQCQKLCDERNLKLSHVKNARDIITAAPTSGIQPGRVYRTGRLSDASPADIQKLMQQCYLQTLVDLRSPTELKDDPTLLRPAVFGNFTNVVWKERGRRRSGCWRELQEGQSPIHTKRFWNRLPGRRHKKAKTAKDVVDAALESNIPLALNDDDEDDDDEEDCPDCDVADLSTNYYTGQRKERLFVSLMNEFKYVKGTVSKLRKRDITKALLKSPGALVSRRVRSSVKKPFLAEINDGGLPMLNELLLRFGAPGIRQVLQLIADRKRHPIAFYCTAGKDRTGMITALVLALCGVEPEDIVEDYTLSANVYAEMNDHQAMVGALSQRNLDPKTFLSAPPSVMRDTLEAINAKYGSVQQYCNWIGFGPNEQEELRRAVMGTDNDGVDANTNSGMKP